jgi:glycosyltransferase involved in cell wall biosynthesis
MHVLFVSPYAPNAIRVRPYRFIRGLLELGHEVTVASAWSSESDRESLGVLESMGAGVIARKIGRWRSLANASGALVSPWPLQAAYSWHHDLATEASRIARSSDVAVVHVEHLRGARYADRLVEDRRQGRLHIPIVWDSVDCVSHLFVQAMRASRSRRWRMVAGWEIPRTRRVERRLATCVDRVLVTSDRDRDALRKVVGGGDPPVPAGRIAVVTNGVDLEGFAPSTEPRPPATLTFTGKMSYHANVTGALHLVDDVMPRVWRQRPEVRVQIVGKAPTRRLLRHARAHGDRVRVTGEVDAVSPFLHASTLAVAPLLYGVGVQNKVLEAMATATPVVATPPAVGGLDRDVGTPGLVVAEGPRALADAILALLGDPERRDRMGHAGRGYVERHHDWLHVTESLVDVYEEAGDEGRSISSSDQR